MTRNREVNREIRRATPGRRRIARRLLTCLAAAGVLVAGRTPQGIAVVTGLREYLEYFAGVFTLLTLTAAVVAGLVAALFVPIRVRVLAQAAHRAAATMSVSFLPAHVLLKILDRRVAAQDIVVPFLSSHDRAVFVGLGTIAAHLLVLVFVVGAMRRRFISASRAWVWRSVHVIAYLLWPVAIVHGLNAGRDAPGWVVAGYAGCVILVVIAAVIRAVAGYRRYRAITPSAAQCRRSTTAVVSSTAARSGTGGAREAVAGRRPVSHRARRRGRRRNTEPKPEPVRGGRPIPSRGVAGSTFQARPEAPEVSPVRQAPTAPNSRTLPNSQTVPDAPTVPDEALWAELQEEAAQWTGGRG